MVTIGHEQSRFIRYIGWKLQSRLTSSLPYSTTNVCTARTGPSDLADELRSLSDFKARTLLRSAMSPALNVWWTLLSTVGWTLLSTVGDHVFPVARFCAIAYSLQNSSFYCLISVTLLTIFVVKCSSSDSLSKFVAVIIIIITCCLGLGYGSLG